MATKLQLILAAQEKAAKVATLEKAKVSAEKKAKVEQVKFIKKFNKAQVVALERAEAKEAKEAKAEAKEIINKMKKDINDLEKELKNKAQDKIEAGLLRSGSWDAIYGSLDGTEKGLALASTDLIRNIKFFIEAGANAHKEIKFNDKLYFDLYKIKGQGEDVALEVIFWLFKNEYFNKQNIYHTDFKYDKDNNLVVDTKFREISILRFSTIVSKGVKKYIAKNYVSKYLTIDNLNKEGRQNYRSYVDVLDLKDKTYVNAEAHLETIQAPAFQELENVEFLDDNGDFRYRLLINKLSERTQENLTETEGAFLEALGNGLNSRNCGEYEFTNHRYKLVRNSLIRKGFLAAQCNLKAEIAKYKN